MNPTATAAPTAADHRAAAAAARTRAAESFERCDTDGFASQHAAELSARLHDARAVLAENDGMIDADALFLLDGTLASTHQGHGQFGAYWVLNDAAAEVLGRRFLSTSEAASEKRRAANNAKKGVSVGTIRVAGYATLTGSGSGMAGMMSCYVAVLPVVEDLIAGRFTVVTTDDAA